MKFAKEKSKLARKTLSQYTKMVIYSYLHGCELYHKIALLDNKQRLNLLTKKRLLHQPVVLTMKQKPYSFQLKYAFELADVIHLVASSKNIDQVNELADRIAFKNDHSEHNTEVYLTVKDLTRDETNRLFTRHLDETLTVLKLIAKDSSCVSLLNRLQPK
jgi:hypothetical protein